MKKLHLLLIKSSIFIFTILLGSQVLAKEGMWVPATLKAHEKDMKAMGLEIPIEQLYNENGTASIMRLFCLARGAPGK